MVKKQTAADCNWGKVSVIIALFFITLILTPSIKNVSYADSTSYSQSSVLGDYNLTVTINDRNLKWDDTLYLNITISNTTSLEYIPNSQFVLNISSLVEIFIIIPIAGLYYLTPYGTLYTSTGSVNRSIPIDHVPTLNPYLLTVQYLNNSKPILNVSFYIYIESVRTAFISFFTFEYFIILYFGLLLVCGIYLGYSKYKNDNTSTE